METNNKFILLTANKRLFQALSQAIRSKKLDLETDLPPLCDIDYIRKILVRTKNTSFIREAYSNFIKKYNGTPLGIIIDYKIDLNLDPELDPDKMKLLKTLLISGVILSNMTNLNYTFTNLICIGSPDSLNQFKVFKDKPFLLYKWMKTSNPQINRLLENKVLYPEKTIETFSFDYILIDEKNDIISASKKLELIIDHIVSRKQSYINREMTKNQTEILKGDFEPAKLIFKISSHRAYMDGKIYDVENNPKFKAFEESMIYIIGHYVNSTLTVVNEKIKKFLLEDLPKIRKIDQDTEINIILNDEAVIDGSTTPSLNIFFSITLRDYKNIHLIPSPQNFGKMEKSPGFISLKNFILKKL
ncbi:MAG: hypothetical protein PHF84_11925 [bacterium]|nr:hypothetical protein [bacterium]